MNIDHWQIISHQSLLKKHDFSHFALSRPSSTSVSSASCFWLLLRHTSPLNVCVDALSQVAWKPNVTVANYSHCEKLLSHVPSLIIKATGRYNLFRSQPCDGKGCEHHKVQGIAVAPWGYSGMWAVKRDGSVSFNFKGFKSTSRKLPGCAQLGDMPKIFVGANFQNSLLCDAKGNATHDAQLSQVVEDQGRQSHEAGEGQCVHSFWRILNNG